MGVDVVITVPGGTADGTYPVRIMTVGHMASGTNKNPTNSKTVHVTTLNIPVATGGGDTTPPNVSTTTPTNGATDVALDGTVSITFDEAVDCSTINTTNITSDSPGWTYNSDCVTDTVSFSTSGQANNTTYNVSVTSAVTDVAGNPLNAAPYNFSYTTIAAGPTPPDTTITAPTASAILSGASFNVTGTATAGTNPLQDVLISTDGGSTYPNTATGTTSWTWSWTLPSEDYVSHTILAKARDNTLLEDPSPASVTPVYVDTVAPTGVSNSTPANSATDVSTSVNLVEGGSTTDGNPAAIQYFFELAEDNGFSTGVQNSGWITSTSWAPTLSGGVIYYWHVKARDGAGNETAYTTTWNFQTAAGCTRTNPSVTILTASKDITNDGGFTDYTVQVTNNDSAACAAEDFSLALSDTNSTNFYGSQLAQSSLSALAPGASAQTTFRVTALANQPNSVTNDTDVTASSANHTDVTSSPVTTTINVSGGGCVASGNYLNANGDQLISSRR
jgi:hypothetical protein